MPKDIYPTEKFCEISGILIANVTMLKKLSIEFNDLALKTENIQVALNRSDNSIDRIQKNLKETQINLDRKIQEIFAQLGRTKSEITQAQNDKNFEVFYYNLFSSIKFWAKRDFQGKLEDLEENLNRHDQIINEKTADIERKVDKYQKKIEAEVSQNSRYSKWLENEIQGMFQTFINNLIKTLISK